MGICQVVWEFYLGPGLNAFVWLIAAKWTGGFQWQEEGIYQDTEREHT